MGMSSSDDESAIMEDYNLQKWAQEKPETLGSYDNPPTEEQRVYYRDSIRKWVSRKPRKRKSHAKLK